MEIREALELKSQFLSEYAANYAQVEVAGTSPQAIVESFSEARPADRLAIGISAKPAIGKRPIRGNVQLELRVQRTDGPAFREAMRIIKGVKKEARLLVLKRLEFPTYGALVDGAKNSNSCSQKPATTTNWRSRAMPARRPRNTGRICSVRERPGFPF